MRIGIPRGLLYYYYYSLWKPLFEVLGMEVIVSKKTCAAMMDRGIKAAVPEICVPIKAYTGHVIDLLEQGVDYVFIPRMVAIDKGHTFCPKFLGLPEMLKHTVPNLKDKLLSPIIRTEGEEMTRLSDYAPVWQALGVSKAGFRKALLQADDVWQQFRSLCRSGHTLEEAARMALSGRADPPAPGGEDVLIGVIGYVYNIYDPYVSMNILEKLKGMQAGVQTFEMVDEGIIGRKLKSLPKALFWTFTNKLWGAADHFLRRQEIDGLIHVTAFNCGPDSMLGRILELDAEDQGKPFMTIRVDEHTGENHLDTRIEAFVDMIRRKNMHLVGAEGL